MVYFFFPGFYFPFFSLKDKKNDVKINLLFSATCYKIIINIFSSNK